MSEIGTFSLLFWVVAASAGAMGALEAADRASGSGAGKGRGGEGKDYSFRRRIHEERVRRKTEDFVNKYQSIVDDLRAQGLDRYVSSEIAEIEARLDEVRSLLATDPFEARSRNMQIGPLIGPLPRIARQRRAQERADRGMGRRRIGLRATAERPRTAEPQGARQEVPPERSHSAPPSPPEREANRLRDQLLDELNAAIQRDFIDQVVLDFAYEELRALRDETTRLELASEGELEQRRKEIMTQLAAIRDRAQQAAEEWRARYEQPIELMLVEDEIKDLESSLPAADPAATKLLDDLKALRDAIRTGKLAGEQLNQQLEEKLEAAEVVVVNEECRREVVRAMYAALQQQGFVVDAPRRIKEGNTDEVVITARKPAGQSAEVRVTPKGEIHYKFLNYEGMECKKDIDKVLDLLQHVYNIPLGEHRIIWQNPDRISKGARPIPGSSQSEGRRG